MIKAFVFGKFLPFHKGHEAMIRFALAKSDFLSVLVCCSDREPVGDGETRKKWIDDTFNDIPNIDVQTLEYREEELPNTSVSSKEVSRRWSEKFKELFVGYDLVVTSEPYGDYVAEYMNIKHEPFDMDRKAVPVSATGIRNDLFRYWRYLPDAVKRSFVKKVVILGTESTGKTTLTERLANEFDCSFVPEAGRDVIPTGCFPSKNACRTSDSFC